MLSLRSIWREADMRLFLAGGAAREILSTSLRAGSSGLKSLSMTAGLGEADRNVRPTCHLLPSNSRDFLSRNKREHPNLRSHGRP